MDMFGITEETAGQISKLMVSADRYDHPGCSWHTWGDPRPQGGPPQPLEKKCKEGHLGQKAKLKWVTSCGQKWNYAQQAELHGINSPLPRERPLKILCGTRGLG